MYLLVLIVCFRSEFEICPFSAPFHSHYFEKFNEKNYTHVVFCGLKNYLGTIEVDAEFYFEFFLKDRNWIAKECEIFFCTHRTDYILIFPFEFFSLVFSAFGHRVGVKLFRELAVNHRFYKSNLSLEYVIDTSANECGKYYYRF